jgi:hypothetical protein
MQFAQSAWGYALSSIPAGVGLAYLIFSLTLGLEKYSETSAQYVQNARSTRFPVLAIVGAIPFQVWFSITALITFSLMVFQGAMLGRSAPVTVGVYLDGALGLNDLAFADRIAVMFVALALLAAFMLLVPWLWRLAAKSAARAALLLPPLPPARARKSSLRRLAAEGAKLFVAIVVALSLILHAAVLLRLFGALGSPFENIAPAIRPEFILKTFGAAVDWGVVGAFIGAVIVCVRWFALTSRAPSSSQSIAPLYLAILAFIPSSFLGALAVGTPAFPRSTEIFLLMWGVITSGALVALLVSGHILGPKLYRYDNLKRARNLPLSVGYFLREYWKTILGLLFLAGLFNAVDAGFRDQFGVEGLASRFTAKLGDWSPDERGLALVLCVLLIVIVWLLRADNERDEITRKSAI